MQTFLALLVVALTVVIFTIRWWQNRNKKGCGGGCGCSAKTVLKR
ncbi:MAG: FeoB-associated Cys-rich membrane protein [Chthoniobacterales bacterium]